MTSSTQDVESESLVIPIDASDPKAGSFIDITFEVQCFSKIILHATKYPQKAVSGLILKKKGSGGKYHFHDAVPMLHSCKYVTPMMEVALAQIDQYCKANKYEILGYYQANQYLNDNKPDFVAVRISEKLMELYPNHIVVMIDNNKLNSNLEVVPFDVYQMIDNKLKPKEVRFKLLPDEEGALSTVSALIQAKAYRDLVDFDNHLDDISQNYWINPAVNEVIKTLAA